MNIFYSEKVIKNTLKTFFDELEAHISIGAGHSESVQYHESIGMTKRDDKVFQFHFLGKDFVILKEMYTTQGYARLKVYQLKFDLKNFGSQYLEELPSMTINIVNNGLMRFAEEKKGDPIMGVQVDISNLNDNVGVSFVRELLNAIKANETES